MTLRNRQEHLAAVVPGQCLEQSHCRVGTRVANTPCGAGEASSTITDFNFNATRPASAWPSGACDHVVRATTAPGSSAAAEGHVGVQGTVASCLGRGEPADARRGV